MADPDQDDSDSLYNENEGSFGEDGVRRPMNAFFIFCKRHRDVVREKYPHLENRSITKILGEWWANLDAAEKFSYTALAKQYKEAFMKAHPDFKWYKLPTPPARTLITRPSNKTKKDKSGTKFGSNHGKPEDEDCLDGLNSFISPAGMDPMPSVKVDCHDTAITTSSQILALASNNILKPPKKRYLVNGEFKCGSSNELPVDDPTQNACSALLELADACASTANPTIRQATLPGRHHDSFLLQPITSTANAFCYDPSVTLQNLESLRQPSLTKCSLDTEPHPSLVGPSTSTTYPIPEVTLSSSMFMEPTVQDQPLDLCKGKGKTFTASNQQLIDHLVDKFLCDTPSVTKPAPEAQPVLNFSPTKASSSMSKIKQICQTYTLSNAIESAIDKAYSTDKEPEPLNYRNNEPFTNFPPPKEGKASEVVFIDKIKKACLASSHKSPEKPKFKRYIIPSSLKEPEIKNSLLPFEKEEIDSQNSVPDASSMEQNDFVASPEENLGVYERVDSQRFSSSEYYSKFVSPPKKSRVWCNLFMKEQLKTSDSDSSIDGKKGSSAFDMASPVRRNSQRSCKGQRYQALITEGLLQSTKERKQLAVKKPFPFVEKIKMKPIPPETAVQLPRTKHKKKELHDRNKSAAKTDELDIAQKVFNLNEKIASLPKCSIETLDKKKKVTPGTFNTGKVIVSVSSEKSLKKQSATKDELPSPKQQGLETSSAKSQQISDESSLASSGRFKSGSFDLEQHIASLPKCDIEVLNKKRNRKESSN